MKSKRRERRAVLACMGLLTVTAALAFATVNSRVKDFEASVEASKVEPVQTIAVVEKVQQTEPAPMLFDVPLSEDLQLHIMAECEKREVDPAVIVAMIERESQYTADVIGDNGNSYGLMQIQYRWWYGTMVELGCTNLLDAKQNTTVGIAILDSLLNVCDGDYGKALTAYNAGAYRGTVTAYANAVLNTAEELKGGIEL